MSGMARQRRRAGVSAGQLGALLEAAADAVVVTDDNGRIEAINAAAEKLFGYSRAEVLGQDVEKLVAGPRRVGQDPSRRYMEKDKSKVIGVVRELDVRDANGRVFPVALSVGESVQGKRRLYIGIARDMSAQKSAEQRARSVESRLIHVGRFNLLGEMTAGIAHEINQPLSAIATYAQASLRLLQREPVDVEALSSSCERIVEQARRAGQVIENLRRLIRKHDARPEPTDLNEAIASTMNLILADAHAEGIDVSTRYASELPSIVCDRVQLQQALLNLTRNAVDAMRDSIRKDRGIVISTAVEGDSHVLISVCDHGHGVPARLGDSIFHPFVTTKRDGLGVGLAISRTIIQSYGGTLSCENNPEGGAVFMIRLPTQARGAGR